MKKAKIDQIFARFAAQNPHPQTELSYTNPYTLLVAIVLSAQATDAGVNKATRALFAVADTPQKMLALGEEVVRDYINTIGLYRNKAKNVIALSEKLIAEFNGEVPRTRAEIESLPGAGRKTANVVLNMIRGGGRDGCGALAILAIAPGVMGPRLRGDDCNEVLVTPAAAIPSGPSRRSPCRKSAS